MDKEATRINRNVMYALIAPFSGSFDDQGLWYLVPEFLCEEVKIGHIVSIPQKRDIKMGIVLKKSHRIDQKLMPEKIKSMIGVLSSEIFIFSYQVLLLQWISEYYFTPIHRASSLFFPKNLQNKIEKSTLKQLKETSFEKSVSNFPILSREQQIAYGEIRDAKEKKIFLWGVTGSGKTEIYIHAIAEVLKEGKQVLVLVPEIIVSLQLWERYVQVFGQEVILISSLTSEATKTKYWQTIHLGGARLIIGTRSALFYPYRDLGLIIVDEEHDSSYISDTAPRYKGVEVALKIAELQNIKILLASGTPSIESMYKVKKGQMKLISLLEKFK